MPQYELIKSFVLSEKAQVLDATQDLREDRRRARRNYERKYDNPIDKATGKEKLFMPLTTQEVNTIAVRYELPEDAITVSTQEPGLERKAVIWQEILRDQFKKMEWNARVKAARYAFVNEGNMVVEMYWNEEKHQVDFYEHDVKNVYIFPKELSLEEASGFGVRRFAWLSDILKDKRYSNTETLIDHLQSRVADDSQSPTPSQKEEVGKSEYHTELEFLELYERHGLFPKKFLMSDEELAQASPQEKAELVLGVLTIADPHGANIVIEASDDFRGDMFAEAWFNRRTYSWYGVGVGVLLRDYQRYYNKIVNRRDNNEDVLHHGMFVKRRGVTVDARQRQTGAGIFIEVDDPNGLQQLNTQDITGPSYTGEQNILSNVERLNGTAEIIRGTGRIESASEAAIKDKNAQGRLGEAQENLNRMFRLCVRSAMKLIEKNMKKSMIVKITGRDDELAMFDDFKLRTVNKARAEQGLPPITQEELRQAMQGFDNTRFLELPNVKFLKGDFNVYIDVDASLIKNNAGRANLILEAMGVAAQIPTIPETIDFPDLFERWLALQGLKVKRREAQPQMQQQAPMQPQQQQAQPQPQPMMDEPLDMEPPGRVDGVERPELPTPETQAQDEMMMAQAGTAATNRMTA